jgi:hypothetical protein
VFKDKIMQLVKEGLVFKDKITNIKGVLSGLVFVMQLVKEAYLAP